MVISVATHGGVVRRPVVRQRATGIPIRGYFSPQLSAPVSEEPCMRLPRQIVLGRDHMITRHSSEEAMQARRAGGRERLCGRRVDEGGLCPSESDAGRFGNPPRVSITTKSERRERPRSRASERSRGQRPVLRSRKDPNAERATDASSRPMVCVRRKRVPGASPQAAERISPECTIAPHPPRSARRPLPQGERRRSRFAKSTTMSPPPTGW